MVTLCKSLTWLARQEKVKNKQGHFWIAYTVAKNGASNFACVTFLFLAMRQEWKGLLLKNENKSLEVKEFALVKYLDENTYLQHAERQYKQNVTQVFTKPLWRP